ncbi:hypothetical protein JW890_06660 [candidate division WOR-3 bacterium]|nr:hypothetical protein [candidate division WOR-3 bacterium]
MNLPKTLFILSGIFLYLDITALTQDQKDLLSAWEENLRNDGTTVCLRPLAEMTYEFKTELFPFEGTLKVLNVVIDYEAYQNDGYRIGCIETELVGVDDDFYDKYYYSYSIWQRGNYLYFDGVSETWVLYRDLNLDYDIYGKQLKPWISFMSVISSFFPIAVILGILIIVIAVMAIMQKKNKSYMEFAEKSTKRSLEIAERALVLNEESNALLKEIEQELKRKNN